MFFERAATALLFLSASGCGLEEDAPRPDPTPIGTPNPTPTSQPVQLTHFGFAAVVCDHDDPFDGDNKTDYSDEVAQFTNLNQVCPNGDIAADAARLESASQSFDPLLYVEPIFFDPATGAQRSQAEAETLWAGLRQSIADSGVDPAHIVFYLFDEPTLRGVPLAELQPVAAQIRAFYPDSKLLLIEAFSTTDAPVVPEFVDLWAFNAYAVRDPAAEPLYVDYLNAASAQLRGGQALVIVGDGIHTPFHVDAGLSEIDMAEVARNYFNLAQSRDDVAALLVYTWAGGIDNDEERGVRDLPQQVGGAWRSVGQTILGI